MTAPTDERRCNIIPERGKAPHPLWLPWSMAELAYSGYAAKNGRSQTLERLAERGGFYPSELDELLPDWRERLDENAQLRAALAASLERERVLREEVGRLTGKLCLICGRKEPCSESPDACTFDPHPIAAAQSFLKRANQAESSLATLRADAERYRFIRGRMAGRNEPGIMIRVWDGYHFQILAEQCDDAIDACVAAIAKGAQP